MATSLNHPPFSAGHVLATTQTAWIPTQRIPRNRQKLALVLLVVVIVINQRVNKRRPIPGRLSTRSLQRVAIKVEEILQVVIEIFRS